MVPTPWLDPEGKLCHDLVTGCHDLCHDLNLIKPLSLLVCHDVTTCTPPWGGAGALGIQLWNSRLAINKRQ